MAYQQEFYDTSSYIDLNISNLHSVNSAYKRINLQSQITSDKKIISDAESIILPGVGSFSEAMSRLKLSNWKM